jgi:hypothetical protein
MAAKEMPRAIAGEPGKIEVPQSTIGGRPERGLGNIGGGLKINQRENPAELASSRQAGRRCGQ